LRGKVGAELVGNADHIWVANAIPGVTDGLVGRKYLRDRGDGEIVE
jgi:hypothetical protein